MFEFDKYDSDRHSMSITKVSAQIEALSTIEKISFMAWGEHCIECAAPQCYTTCDLYQARFDKKCRRFEYGMYKNKSVSTFRSASAELVFKKWGKLEAIGNTSLYSLPTVILLENLFSALSPAINTLGIILGRVFNDTRWNSLSHRLSERLVYRLQNFNKSNEFSSASFLLEIYNPHFEAVNIKLSLAINLSKLSKNIHISQLPQPFLTSLNIAPGFFRKIIPASDITGITNSNLPFTISLMPNGDENLHLVFISLDFVKFTDSKSNNIDFPIHNQIINKPHIKCIVFDLDNTLWHGILLENENIILREGLAELMDSLDKQGILFSIASKNSHNHAWTKLKDLGLDKYFLYPKINWLPKSQNIKQIAKDLNIGLDTFLFIDDNPFELQEVGQSIPEVTCLHVDCLSELGSYSRFQGSTSEDAKNRRILYQQEILRKDEQSHFGDDYVTFLRSCNIEITMSNFSEDNFDRVAELVQRTNQLNFSGKKYNRLQIRDIINDSKLEKWVITCKDKFGSYGTIGFCIAHRQDNFLEILDLMLSCRVQGKFIEQAIFAYLVNIQLTSVIRLIKINFHPTEKNGPAQQVLNQLGFIENEIGGMSKTLGDKAFDCNFILVNS